MDGCIRRVQSVRSRQATTSHSRPGPDLFWTTLMMQPLVLPARECQLSHWDPVRQRPHLRPRASAQSCPSWDKFKYTAFGCAAAPHPPRHRTGSNPRQLALTFCWRTTSSEPRGTWRRGLKGDSRRFASGKKRQMWMKKNLSQV